MSTNSPVSLSSSDPPESFTVHHEGYDYVFVPPLGPGYDCPICLSALREPRQTKCGHRFCRDCIIHWMKDSSTRCPVDNETLTDVDIFPDNCIKREILTHDIKCPNHIQGCLQLTTILQIQKHLEQCLLALVQCPLNCPCVIPRRDIEDHLEYQCENRDVTCENCNETMTAGKLNDHKNQCPKTLVCCEYCRAEILREKMASHQDSECRKIIIACPFEPWGCTQSIARENTDNHLNSGIPDHLKMISTSFNTFTDSFSSLAVMLRELNKQLVNSHIDNHINSISDCVPNSGRVVRNSDSELLRRQRDQNGVKNVDEHRAVMGSMPRSSVSSMGESVVTNELNESVDDFHSSHTHSQSSGSNEMRKDTNSNSNNTSPTELPPSSSKFSPVLCSSNTSKELASETSSPDRDHDDTSAEAIPRPSGITEFVSCLQELCSHQQNMLVKQQTIITNLCSKLAATESRLQQLEEGGAGSLMQHSFGDFYWTIDNFKQYRDKAVMGETTILHSPPFHSSPWGYKLCLRVNINSGLNPQGEHFLSLFIHFMQGHSDNLLNWPFSGKIILSIIDQNPSSQGRRHATETLNSRPDIAAFQKPTSDRNHKGFGYTDFISLGALEKGTFVSQDTFIVHAQVFPSSDKKET